MKKTFLTVAIALLSATTLFANSIENNTVNIEVKKTTKTATFGVRGNCGMCKKTIEAAAMGVDGVESATWDTEKKEITVVYNSNTTLMDIHKAIANVGYDTDKVTATNSTYNGLPGCCQYDRKQEMMQKGEASHEHSHEGCHH